MSLQGLISGAECAVPFNPLSQVVKHTEGDRSLQQDRVAGPSGSRLHHLPTSSAPHGSQQDLAMARQFFEGGPQQAGAPPSFAVPRHVMPHEPERFMSAPAQAGPDLTKAWNEMQAGRAVPGEMLRSHTASGGWSAEFDGVSQIARPSSQQNMPMQSNFNQTSYMQPGLYGRGMPVGMSYGMGMGMSQMSMDHGKGKARDIDFDAAFAQVHASFADQTEGARITEVTDDELEQLAEGLDSASLDKGKSKATEDVPYEETNFQEVWDQLQNSDIPPPKEEMAKWEAQFNQMMNAQREDLDFDYGGMMQKAWDSTGNSEFSADPVLEFDDQGIPALGEYVFEKGNKFLDPTHSRSTLQQAKDLLAQNGSLSEAALLLEAAIQHGDLGEGGYEAWILLGETRSMDERDDAAMRALSEGVKRAEAAGAAGAGMLSLAIAYTNESLERASHTMLLRWLHARFPDAKISEEQWKSLSLSSWHSQEQVTEAYLAIAREQYTRGEVDPDVQIGLGVLFYTSGDYNRAKDCFEAALSMRPKDYLLWNRLGSCLSNGNKPEEALGAYREALQLRPTYTRAIYNVGVACLNIGAHKEAIEHFLSALALQESSGGGKSEQLWTTLRRAFQAMDRMDLADMARPETNLEAFRDKGFDF
ncbi:peroxisome targeting signal receptor [Dichomitus squalens LYAD-421 SS1]|uniref:peroxisome targeting signal receptor n=1 Tax=Dichomitus squalens (strain LYAD-421) TaxID=732165 RepID=UPI0004410C78|nr:peroxisome targeting signal receptor [Dichomitus squalens LYAD-421 SS1]EJF65576.1 peroxisome targeting signal receptor [Dichomitus squalens LYAD-421 SS1]